MKIKANGMQHYRNTWAVEQLYDDGVWCPHRETFPTRSEAREWIKFERMEYNDETRYRVVKYVPFVQPIRAWTK